MASISVNAEKLQKAKDRFFLGGYIESADLYEELVTEEANIKIILEAMPVNNVAAYISLDKGKYSNVIEYANRVIEWTNKIKSESNNLIDNDTYEIIDKNYMNACRYKDMANELTFANK